MTQKEVMQDNAMQDFDICIRKHAQTVKNCLYTIIGHAYNEGYKEGLKQVKSTEIEEKPVYNPVLVGDVFYLLEQAEWVVVTARSGEDAIVLFKDGHTETYFVEILEDESMCVRSEKVFDIREKFRELEAGGLP